MSIQQARKALKVFDLADVFTFGKHAERTVFYVLERDPQYIVWLSENHKTLALKQRIIDTAKEAVDKVKRRATERDLIIGNLVDYDEEGPLDLDAHW